MKFIVREAEQKDLNSITALFEKKGDYPVSPFGREKKEIFSTMLENRTRHVLVGEKNDKICAVLSMKIENTFQNSFDPSAIIFDIKSSEENSEILCAVLSRAVATAMENSCREIILLDKNSSVQTNSVYSICGFKQSLTHYIKKL